MKHSIDNLTKEVGNIDSEIKNFDNEISNIDISISLLENNVKILQGIIGEITEIKLVEQVSLIEQNTSTHEVGLKTLNWSNNQIVAEDTNNGIRYEANELIDKKLLIPYENNGQEVIFYGQFNSEYHWNEDCIINVYIDNKLVFVMEAYYNDGQVLFYKQMFTEGNPKTGTWTISTRVSNDGVNTGNSWKYRKNGKECEKSFGLDEVKLADIIDVDRFKEMFCNDLESFYHGNTSEGYYNDSTGNAYCVKYAEDGTIRTLYVGCFAEGKYCDGTGDAWYITKGPNTGYMYYKGKFEDNTASKKGEYEFENPITLQRIEEIVAGYDFDCPMIWKEK